MTESDASLSPQSDDLDGELLETPGPPEESFGPQTKMQEWIVGTRSVR
jgi:hypothetical protein